MSSDATAATETSASASSSADVVAAILPSQEAPSAAASLNDAESPTLTLEDGAAAVRRVFRGGGGGSSGGGGKAKGKAPSQRSRAPGTAKPTTAPRRPKAGGGRSRGGGVGGVSGQARRRVRGGGPKTSNAAASASPTLQPALPPGAVPIFTDDFLRLNAQREKSARQLRRSVIVREEEALLRARHTEDLADAVADLLARRDADKADYELLDAALTDLRRRVLEAFPELAAAALATDSSGDKPEASADNQRLVSSINQLSDRLDPAAVRQLMLDFVGSMSATSE